MEGERPGSRRTVSLSNVKEKKAYHPRPSTPGLACELSEYITKLAAGNPSEEEKLQTVNSVARTLNVSLTQLLKALPHNLNTWDPLVRKLVAIQKRSQRLDANIAKMRKYIGNEVE